MLPENVLTYVITALCLCVFLFGVKNLTGCTQHLTLWVWSEAVARTGRIALGCETAWD